ncbi:MAG: hypothetical protein HN576_15555 [Bacteriovoracaceae bacterium]|nr:hypothetical protein [Bacteriovoracaceae bacterium]
MFKSKLIDRTIIPLELFYLMIVLSFVCTQVVAQEYLSDSLKCDSQMNKMVQEQLLGKSRPLKLELSKRYLEASTKDFCRVFYIKQQFAKGKPAFCLKKESPEKCIMRVQKEIMMKKPLTATGITLYIAATALEIFKSRKRIIRKEHERNEKMVLGVYFGMAVIKASVDSIKYMDKRNKIKDIYSGELIMPLEEISIEAMNYGLNLNSGKPVSVKGKYPYLKTKKFELAVLQVTDEIMVSKFIQVSCEKSLELTKMFLEKYEMIKSKLKDPKRLKLVISLNKKIKRYQQELIEFQNENKKRIEKYQKYIL